MQRNRKLALALEPNIMVNSTSMSWQHVCLPLKTYIVDFDDQAAARCPYRVMLSTELSSHAGDDATVVTWLRCDVDVKSCWRRCCRVDLVVA
jgi:hypothetical protein